MRLVDAVLARRELAPVDRHRDELQAFAVEYQRLVGRVAGGVAGHLERAADAGLGRPDVDVERHGGDQERGRRVVLEIDGLGSGVTHGMGKDPRRMRGSRCKGKREFYSRGRHPAPGKNRGKLRSLLAE
jgi:hypothetical protein